MLLAIGLAPLQANAEGCLFGEDQWGRAGLSTKPDSFASEEIAFIERTQANTARYFEPMAGRLPDSRFRRYGEPVGRLEVLSTLASGKTCISVCTAFLITENIALTNKHCVAGAEVGTVRSIQLRLGFLSSQQTGRVFGVEYPPAEVGSALDYALLRVGGNPADFYGVSSMKAVALQPGQDLIVIGHPLGQVQQFSVAKCTVGPPSTDPASINHFCQTGSGNSGSPILDESSGAVVALHQRGPGQISRISRLDEAGSVRIGLSLTSIIAVSPTLQAVSKSNRRVSVYNLQGYDLEFRVYRNDRLFCEFRGQMTSNIEQICPVAISPVETAPVYSVKGRAMKAGLAPIPFGGNVSVDEGDDSGSCTLLIHREVPSKPIMVNQVCG